MLQFKRGTNSQVNAFVPLEGQPLWNLDTNVLTIGDGVTPGGVNIAGIITVNSISGITPFTLQFLNTVQDAASARGYIGAAPAVHTHYLADLVDITPFGISFAQQNDGSTALAALSGATINDLNNIQTVVNSFGSTVTSIQTYINTVSTAFVGYDFAQSATPTQKTTARANIDVLGYTGTIAQNNIPAFTNDLKLYDSGLNAPAVSAAVTSVSTLSSQVVINTATLITKADKGNQLLLSTLSDGTFSDYIIQSTLFDGAPRWIRTGAPLASIRRESSSGNWELTNASGVVIATSIRGFPTLPQDAAWSGGIVISEAVSDQPYVATTSNHDFIKNAILPFTNSTVPYQRIDVSVSRALLPSDHGAVLICTNGVTLTANGLPSTFYCEVVQEDTMQVTFASGFTTVRNSFNFTKTRGQYAIATARMVSGELYTSGDMSN